MKIEEIQKNENIEMIRIKDAVIIDYNTSNDERKFVLIEKHDKTDYPFNYYSKKINDIKDKDKPVLFFIANEDALILFPETEIEKDLLSREVEILRDNEIEKRKMLESGLEYNEESYKELLIENKKEESIEEKKDEQA